MAPGGTSSPAATAAASCRLALAPCRGLWAFHAPLVVLLLNRAVRLPSSATAGRSQAACTAVRVACMTQQLLECSRLRCICKRQAGCRQVWAPLWRRPLCGRGSRGAAARVLGHWVALR